MKANLDWRGAVWETHEESEVGMGSVPGRAGRREEGISGRDMT